MAFGANLLVRQYLDHNGLLADCNQKAAPMMGLADRAMLLRRFYRSSVVLEEA